MAEQKDDPGQAAKSAQSKKSAPVGGASEQLGTADKTPAAVVRRKQRYLIGFRSLPGIVPLPRDPFLEKLDQMEGVEIIRRLRSAGSRDPAAMPIAAAPNTSSSEIVVARMDEQLGEVLRQNAPPHVIVELDAPLGYSDMAVPEPLSWLHAVQAMPFPRPRRELRFRILGEGERPLANAAVNLYGPEFPGQAITDSTGHATLQTHTIDGMGIRAVYVRPAADHWERYIPNPALETEQVNVIRLSPIDRMSRNFPGERPYGWGQRIMKFDRIIADWNGAGTKIGIIDSGCDTSHPLLRHIARGADLTGDNDPQSWRSDELGQGTHCAGTIAAAAVSTGAGSAADIIGCAPGAEVHVFKVLPGGHFSDLIAALGQCIERRLDIVQVGVSGEQFSELVAQKFIEARSNGIACVAGAGNSGAAVQFPGNIPGVLTVSAVGKLAEYPQDTRHAQRALPQLMAYSGIYATNFSCWGPQVAVCAPGVAVISCVPGGGIAAWDGSAMAASHVVGFAALLLSHHPMLHSINFGTRADQRVAVLHDLLRAAAVPYAQVNPIRVGAGLPDLQQVPGLLPISQQFAGLGTQPTPFTHPDAYLGNPMKAILQLRAAGLWV